MEPTIKKQNLAKKKCSVPVYSLTDIPLFLYINANNWVVLNKLKS